jgi:methionyl-tRNA formyltransferase
VRVVFAGTPETAVPSLSAVLDSRHDVAAVLTRPDAPVGRGRKVIPSPVAQVAADAGIEVLKPQRPRDPDFLARLAEIRPDCAPVVAYGGLLPRAALDVPKHGWVNLHFSLLPAWRGAAPVQHAILAGDEITGASTFQIEEELDSGPVYGVVTEAVRPTDTSGDLLERLAMAGATLLVATLDGIDDGTLVARPQASAGVTWAPKLSVADAEVDWSAPAVRVDSQPTDLAAGQVRAERDGIRVGTGSSAVLLGEVQPPSKRAMRADDWVRGARLDSAERLGR